MVQLWPSEGTLDCSLMYGWQLVALLLSSTVERQKDVHTSHSWYHFSPHTLMVVITVSDGNWVFLKLFKNDYSHFQGIGKLQLRVVKPHIFAYKAPELQMWNLNFLFVLLMTRSSLQPSIILVAYSYTYSSKVLSEFITPTTDFQNFWALESMRITKQSVIMERKLLVNSLWSMLKLQHFGCEEPTHWKRPWCWERLRAREEGDNGGWDSWMATLTQWTWVWANSGR